MPRWKQQIHVSVGERSHWLLWIKLDVLYDKLAADILKSLNYNDVKQPQSPKDGF